MVYVAAVYLMAAVLLGAAGATKAITPEPAAAALTTLGLPHSLWWVRFLGLVELDVATIAFVVGGAGPAIALAALYGGFAHAAWAMVRSDSTVPCGCFGRVEMPATRRHVVVNILALAAGVVAAAWPVESIDKLFDTRQWLLAPFLAAVVAGAYGVFGLLKLSRNGSSGTLTSLK